MARTYIQNGSRQISPKAQALSAANPVANRFQVMMGIVLTLLVILAGQSAHADQSQDPQLARIAPNAPLADVQPLAFSGACDAGTLVLKVKNVAKAWPERGAMRIISAESGVVVRERLLALGENQTASYRLPVVQDARYRVEVSLPGGLETMTRTFVDRCPPARRVAQRASGR